MQHAPWAVAINSKLSLHPEVRLSSPTCAQVASREWIFWFVQFTFSHFVDGQLPEQYFESGMTPNIIGYIYPAAAHNTASLIQVQRASAAGRGSGGGLTQRQALAPFAPAAQRPAARPTNHCTDEATRYLPLNTVQGRERLKHLIERDL